MRREHHAYYPDGIAADENSSVGHSITDLDYSELGRPFGFFGKRVERLENLRKALQEGVAAVEKGHTAILNIILDDAI